MSRSGYTDDCENNWAHICWRGAVASGIRGKRGQEMLKETLQALDAMPNKVLAADSLVNAEGQYCTLGVLGAARGVDLKNINADCPEEVAEAFNISEALAQEIMFKNDELIGDFNWDYIDIVGPLRPFERRTISVKTPNLNQGEQRWQHMRDWVSENIIMK